MLRNSYEDCIITLQPTDTLDNELYSIPITIRRPLPRNWLEAIVTQNELPVNTSIIYVNSKQYLMRDVVPDSADTNTLKNNLDRLAATGLPIYISEFDLGNLSNSGTPNDNQQLQLYQKVFPILWRHSGVKGITIWDYLEGQTWQTTCYLVHSDGTARPALLWLAQYVMNNPTGVEATVSTLPSMYQLKQNFPNPFNPSTQIQYSIPHNGYVSLKVYNLLGQEVATLFNGVQKTGNYTATFDGSRLSSGVYFYRLQSDKFAGTKKLVLINSNEEFQLYRLNNEIIY